MTVTNTFIKKSFEGDIFKRELRLSVNELEELKQIYPNARFCKMSESHEDKSWYNIHIKHV
ncbi:hypothetical protein [Tenuibacillus multivorans]|uniref:hypothetical protein n=1 Tax=Tenuibacillus multivorans TaxID=237069 RepID=UPI001649DFEC|nr:hypothetical protein [Tenuibacillus multivorans]